MTVPEHDALSPSHFHTPVLTMHESTKLNAKPQKKQQFFLRLVRDVLGSAGLVRQRLGRKQGRRTYMQHEPASGAGRCLELRRPTRDGV
jgi:hypothetical protein